jgi:deazaflavin-dependent oxidoreductase (nitroreductase family)
MTETQPTFLQPSRAERIFNRLYGWLVGLGLGTQYNYQLQVRGRKSGKIYSTPVNLLEHGNSRFLIAPRGDTQWVRNARAAGVVTLKRGSRNLVFRVREVPDEKKDELLKAYLDSFKTTVQRYFPIPAGSPTDAFARIAGQYPVFELLPISDGKSAGA